MVDQKKTVCIEFFCPVTDFTVMQLVDIVKTKIKEKTERFIILISSPGGSVFHALSAYNLLRGLPVEIITHNFGSVDSSAGIIYCAGSKRYSVPDARFLIHPLIYNLQGGYFEEQMEEHLKNLQLDTQNTVGVLAATTGKKEDEVLDDMKKRKHLNPEQAMEYGLVDEIKTELVEVGTEIIKVQPQPPQQPQVPFRFVTNQQPR